MGKLARLPSFLPTRADLSIAKPLEPQKFADARRGSRHARGYGSEWEALRARILKRDGYVCQCEDCKEAGRILPARDVDHILAKAHGGSDEESNLRAMNADCHKRKTAREGRGGRFR